MNNDINNDMQMATNDDDDSTSLDCNVGNRRLHRLKHCLRIICVNDVYTFEAVNGHGGWSKCTTLIRKLRDEKINNNEENKDTANNTGNTVITTVNGDVLGGASLLQHSKGKLAIDIMNTIPIDYAVIGNHEFDYGDDVLKECINHSKNYTKWFGSNIKEKVKIKQEKEKQNEDEGNDKPSTTKLDEKGTNEETNLKLFDGLYDYDIIEINNDDKILPKEKDLVGDTSSDSDDDDVEKLKIGLFGLCTCSTPILSYPSTNVQFDNPIDVAKEVVKKLKDDNGNDNGDGNGGGVHVIIALTHLSSNEDKNLITSLQQQSSSSESESESEPIINGKIDIILGGHDHEPLAQEYHHTLIFKCGQNGYWVGCVDINIEYDMITIPNTTRTSNSTSRGIRKTKHIIDKDSIKLYPSWSMYSTYDIKEDINITNMVNEYQKEVDEIILKNYDDKDDINNMLLDDVLATISTKHNNKFTLDTRTASVRRKETTSGNMIADAMLSYYQELLLKENENENNNDNNNNNNNNNEKNKEILAMINGGFIRGDKEYPPNTKIMLRDILEELPFPRKVILLEILGKYLIKGLEEQLSKCPLPSGSYPHLSNNVQLLYDVKKSIGKRICKLLINGIPCDINKKYYIAVTDFVASGGDGCSSWCYGIPIHDVQKQKRLSTIVIKYLCNKKQIYLKLDGRVKSI